MTNHDENSSADTLSLSVLPSEIMEQIFMFTHGLTIRFYERPDQPIQFNECFGKTETGAFVRMFPNVTMIFKEAGVKDVQLVDANEIDFLWKYAIHVNVICAYRNEGLFKQVFSEQLFDSLASLRVQIIGYNAREYSDASDVIFSQVLQRDKLRKSLQYLSYQSVTNPEIIQLMFRSFPNLRFVRLGLRFPSKHVANSFTFDNIDHFYDHPKLNSVVITGAKTIEAVNSLLRHKKLTLLEYTLESKSMNEETLALIESHPSLTTLRVGGDEVPKLALRAAAQIPTLKHLTLFCNYYWRRYSFDELSPPNAKCKLQSFVTNSKLLSWEALENNTDLTTLSISFYKDRDIAIDNLAKYGKHIQHLTLVGSVVHDPPIQRLAEMPSLRELDVVRLAALEVIHVDKVLENSAIERLIISDKALPVGHLEMLLNKYGSRLQVTSKAESMSSNTLLF